MISSNGSFHVGDKVVYPNHGVGVIEQISSLEASPSRGRLEQMISCPVAEGTRLYIRQTDRLYCIETEGASVR